MKRSEAIKKLLHKVVSPFEIIEQEYYENGVYHDRAERLLEFIEKELGMLPPTRSGWRNNPITQEFCHWNEWEPEETK